MTLIGEERGLEGLTVLYKTEMDKQSSYFHDPLGSTHPRVGREDQNVYMICVEVPSSIWVN